MLLNIKICRFQSIIDVQVPAKYIHGINKQKSIRSHELGGWKKQKVISVVYGAT